MEKKRLIEITALIRHELCAGCCECGKIESCDDCCDKASREIAEIIREHHGWIPVSERLPEHDDDVLVTTIYRGFRFVGVDRYLPEEEEWYHLGKDEVFAWMPMPQPYRGE